MSDKANYPKNKFWNRVKIFGIVVFTAMLLLGGVKFANGPTSSATIPATTSDGYGF